MFLKPRYLIYPCFHTIYFTTCLYKASRLTRNYPPTSVKYNKREKNNNGWKCVPVVKDLNVHSTSSKMSLVIFDFGYNTLIIL